METEFAKNLPRLVWREHAKIGLNCHEWSECSRVSVVKVGMCEQEDIAGRGLGGSERKR